MTSPAVDFTPLESFHLLYKNLWSMNVAYRVKMNMVDTVLFKDGRPYCWLFTSEQTGEIMKKKDDRLHSYHDIIRAFKVKSREYTGSKEIVMRNKVAIVWYMEMDRKILSHIVDEAELKQIMAANLTEILCIQTYIGGQYFRGNGVFEHRMWTQKDGSIKHITYESINMQRDCLDRFTAENEKLVVTEHQHGALSAIAKQLSTHMAFLNKCKVTGLIFLAVFSEGWVPHIIAARRISFAGIHFDLAEEREERVYPTGRAPSAPTINPQSLLLPRSVTEYALRRASALPRNGSVSGTQAPSGSGNCNSGAVPSGGSANEMSGGELADAAGGDVPAAPATEASPATPSTASRKVRSSSLSFDHSGKYPNFNIEQERKAQQLSRQVSAKAAQMMNDAVEEAQKLAFDAPLGVSGKWSPSSGSQRRVSASAKLATGGSQSQKFAALTRVNSAGVGGSGGISGGGGGSGDGGRNGSEYISGGGATRALMNDVAAEVNRTMADNASDTAPAAPVTATPPPPRRQSAGSSTAAAATKGDNVRNSLLTNKGAPLMHSTSAKVVSHTQFPFNATATTASPTSNNSIAAEAADTLTAMTSETGPRSEGAPPVRLHRALTTSNLDSGDRAAGAGRGLKPFGQEEQTQMRIPPIDPTREASRIGYNSEDYYATVHMGAKPSMLHQLQASKSVRPPNTAAPETPPNKASASGKLQPSNGSRRLSAEPGTSRKQSTQTMISAAPTMATTMTRTADYPAAGASTPIQRLYRPASAGMVAKLHQSIDKVKTVHGASSGQLGKTALARRASTLTGMDSSDAAFKLETFEMQTETSAAQTAYHKSTLNDDENALHEQQQFFAQRRPISAPHTLRPKVNVPKELLPPGDHDRYAHLETPHPKGFSLAKVLPLSGILCFGDYCDFNSRAKNAAVNENRPHKRRAAHSHERSSDCPHQLTYKSILLARAEVKFLGTDIDENIESLLDQIRLSGVTTEQLYTYFVRRHLNRVAQKCQEEGRKMQVSTAEIMTPQQQQSDMNLVYRQLVYADALASIHPSRFYYTVPLCEMCYQVYTFMDAQREVAVLHNPDNHLQATVAAAATAERAKFSAAARATMLVGAGTSAAAAAAAQLEHAHRIRVRLGLGAKAHAGKDSYHEHAAGHEGEDPYIANEFVNTDQFIPHHSAQRDSFEDQHKKDNFATALRNSVANIKLYAAQSGSPGRTGSPGSYGGAPLSPSHPDHAQQPVGHDPQAHQSHQQHQSNGNAHTPPHSSRRKVVLDRDRVPVNQRAVDRLNVTHDAGIGSKGPILPDQVNNELRTSGTIVNWVRLMQRPPAMEGGTSALYHKLHGWHTNQQWDHQGSPPHLRPTSATVQRLRQHRVLQRPHSANAVHRRGSETSTQADNHSGLDGSGGASAHVKFASGSQLQQSFSRINTESLVPSKTPSGGRGLYETEVEQLQAAIRRKSRRPRSAGAISSRSGGKGAKGVTREDSIAALEVELANKMLELSTHLAEHPQLQPIPDPVERAVLERYADETESEYAYTSLPFMAAPYFPSQAGNPSSVDDAAYTQLQIDPTSHAIIPPQPTPQQLRQMQLEAEQRAIEMRIAAERARLEEERQQQLAQLEADRQALKEQQRLARSGSIKTLPSTEFTPVSASRPPLRPEHSERSLPLGEGDESGELKGGDNGPDGSLTTEEGAQYQEDDEQHEQEVLRLQLQQQKEFRDLQHQQQLLHQRHQQEMMLQQRQHEERQRLQEQQQEQRGARLSRPTSAGPHTTTASSLTQLHIPVIDGAKFAAGGVRESVELSPMSPPVFEFLLESSIPHPNGGVEEAKGEWFAAEGEDGGVYVDGEEYAQDTDFEYFGESAKSQRGGDGQHAESGAVAGGGDGDGDGGNPDSGRTESRRNSTASSVDDVHSPSVRLRGTTDAGAPANPKQQAGTPRSPRPAVVAEQTPEALHDSPDSTPATSSKMQLSVSLSPFASPAHLQPQVWSPPARRQSRATEITPTEVRPVEANVPVIVINQDDAALKVVIDGPQTPIRGAPVAPSPQHHTPHAQRQSHPTELFTGYSQKVHAEEV